MQPTHPEIIDETMANEPAVEDANGGGSSTADCSLRVNDEPTLTQMIEEGMEDAEEEEEIDDLI